MKRKTIRFKLFFSYSTIILVSLFAVMLFFLIKEVSKLNENIFNSLKQNGINIATSMDREFEQMLMVGTNIAFSNLIKDRFLYYVSGDTDEYKKLENTKVLIDLLIAIIGPNRPVDQINLYAPTNEVLSCGLWSGSREAEASSQEWYDAILIDTNSKAFVFSGEDPLVSKYFTGALSKNFITLANQYYDTFHNPQGFMELKKSLSSVLHAAISYQSVYGEHVYIFDGDGKSIYPLPNENENVDYLFENAKNNMFPGETTKLVDSDIREYYICVPSKYTDFVTIMVISERDLLSPATNYIQNILIITALALLAALLVTYYIAKRITSPIGVLYGLLADYDTEVPVLKEYVDTDIIEINALYDNFFIMHEKIKDSINKQMLLQKQDMQSRMLALQSQMNPHFLYNSLATIQSLADEGSVQDITALCQSMSNILRYISSDDAQEVPLKDELSYTEDYLSCMTVRYDGDLTFSINIPEDMLHIMVPKLCVQILVENAIKYSSTKRPPYHISIKGETKNGNYEIAVNDNGPGFSEEALADVRKKIAEIDDTGLLPTLEINGMGLANVYLRYKLLHSDDVIFKIENGKPKGACVTIGGEYGG